MVLQNFLKNWDNFFILIFIYCINYKIIEKVVLLKFKSDEFWINDLFALLLAYILIIF